MRHILLHGHIFKNAGSTLDWSLKQNFGPGFLDHREDKLMRRSGREHLAQLVNEQRDLCALSSHHMTRDLPRLDAVDFIPLNLLRHPIARIRSVYAFERKQRGNTPGAKAAKQKSFRDYVAWRMQPDVARTIRNYQTLYLAGHHQPCGDLDVASRYFPQALQHVASQPFLGIVERYDESMVLFEEGLRDYFPDIDLSYVAQNVSRGGTGAQGGEDVVADVLADLGDLQQQIIDQNSFDLAIYQAAALRLQQRIDGMDGFVEKLQAFRSRLRDKPAGLSRLWKSG